MANNLLDLALRCEQASGSDRELLEAVALALGWTKRDYTRCGRPVNVQWRRPGKGEDYFFTRGPDNFLASLDAAMTLVPEGHHWQVGIGIETEFGHRDRAYAWCSQEDTGELSLGATPALALTAASLRARAALAGEGEGS